MKENKLSVMINQPSPEVFEFVVNPANTPKWIFGIVSEETDRWPVTVGTVYTNHSREGKAHSYKMINFEQDKVFELRSQDGNYHVRYTCRPIRKNETELTYFEWVEKGELKEPFTPATLEKVKSILESTE